MPIAPKKISTITLAGGRAFFVLAGPTRRVVMTEIQSYEPFQIDSGLNDGCQERSLTDYKN